MQTIVSVGDVSNSGAAEPSRELLEIAVLKELRETLSVEAALFVELQAVLKDLDHLILAENPRQLAREPGMAAEPAAQLDPKPAPGLGDGSRGAGPDALAAIQAAPRVDPRGAAFRGERYRLLGAGLDAGLALGAGLAAWFPERQRR